MILQVLAFPSAESFQNKDLDVLSLSLSQLI